MNFIYKSIDKMDKFLGKLESVMLAFAVIAMAITMIAAVITRFVFNDALTFADELNMIFIVVVTFAGLSYAARNGRHIRMSAIYDMMSTKSRKILMVFMAIVTASFMFILAYYAALYIVEVYKSGRILPALGIPVYYIYLWVPVGFIVTGLQYTFTAIKNLREKDVYLSTHVLDGYSDASYDV